jgi:hypothetical protein
MTDRPFRIDRAEGELAPADVAVLTQLVASGLGDDAPASDAVCVVRAQDGALAGASFAEPVDVELVGGQRLALFAHVLAPEASGEVDALLSATFAALDEDFDAEDRGRALGLCLITGDPAEHRRRPEAQWTDPPMTYAGRLGDGRLVRVAWFTLAQVDLERLHA